MCLLPASAAPAAQGALTVIASAAASCAAAQFAITVEGGVASYELDVDFGDGETLTVSTDGSAPTMLDHTYAVGGSYAWSVTATSGDLSGQASGTLAIGPSVTLSSDPFPPLLPLAEGGASLTLMAEVTGGAEPYTYAWTLEGASASTSDSAERPAPPTVLAASTPPAWWLPIRAA